MQKVDWWLPVARKWEEIDSSLVSLVGDENILELAVIAAQLCECTKNHELCT